MTAHVGDQAVVAGHDLRVRGRQQGQQRRRVVVEAVEGHPGDAAVLGPGPLGQQGRLAVASRRGDTDHAAVARPRGLDELGTTHRTRARSRDRELGLEKQRVDFGDRRRCPPVNLGHDTERRALSSCVTSFAADELGTRTSAAIRATPKGTRSGACPEPSRPQSAELALYLDRAHGRAARAVSRRVRPPDASSPTSSLSVEHALEGGLGAVGDLVDDASGSEAG